MDSVQSAISACGNTILQWSGKLPIPLKDALGSPCTAAAHAALLGVALTQGRDPYRKVPRPQYPDDTPDRKDGGDLVAECLKRHGVEQVFTLIGGHISPMLVGCKRRGIRVIDVRHEVTTVFAADAVSRSSGVPGVAMVTAGPGVTNTITAVKNAQMAQSPVILFGGATAGLLKGRGSLQDIDQMALLRPIVKYCVSISRTEDIVPTIEKAFQIAQSGVPGPVFIEAPLDLLYPKKLIMEELNKQGKSRGSSPLVKLENWVVGQYFNWYSSNLYSGLHTVRPARPLPLDIPFAFNHQVNSVAQRLASAKRPVLLVGSQSMVRPQLAQDLAAAVKKLGIPTYLSSAARGLLGRNSDTQLRHKRRDALREADLVILAGVVMDFRLGYGRSITKNAHVVSINRSLDDLYLNRTPSTPIHGDPCDFVLRLAQVATVSHDSFSDWYKVLQEREEARNAGIVKDGETVPDKYINPIKLCQELEEVLGPDDIMVADGGDFVGTASYITKPRGPLSWLDPGAFGTLGVGGGFAMGAKLAQPDKVVWILYGDGSCGYSVAEFDTYARHSIPVIALVGNDACWSQIYRDQIKLFNDDVACNLAYTPYEDVAKGYGGEGLVVTQRSEIKAALQRAREIALSGKPVLVNAKIAKSNFREGSISV